MRNRIPTTSNVILIIPRGRGRQQQSVASHRFHTSKIVNYMKVSSYHQVAFLSESSSISKRGLPGRWRCFSGDHSSRSSNDNGYYYRNTFPASATFSFDQVDERKKIREDTTVATNGLALRSRRSIPHRTNPNPESLTATTICDPIRGEVIRRALIATAIHHAISLHHQRRHLSSSNNDGGRPTSTPTSPPRTTQPDSRFDFDEHSVTPRPQSEDQLSTPESAADTFGKDTFASSSSSSSSSSPFLSIIQVPKYSQDAEKAMRGLQQAQKERARSKTAANVRRALIGNLVICASKFGAWLSSGSSSMMSEFVHSLVDCGNQALLLMGLRDSRNAADNRHPYGYGKSVYFWALVSALGTFFLGAGVSMSHAVHELWNPSLSVITNEVWAVLCMSFLVDGYVLYKTVSEIESERPKDMSFLQYTSQIRDPATLAVLLEDGAACLGIIIAIAGISASHATGNPVFDGMAGVGISALLGGIGLALVRMNHRFLIGQGVSRSMIDDIERIITARRSIDHVSNIQSQWTGPETFSFKAEVDFDGTYLAAHLMPRYKSEFEKAKGTLDQELDVLLSWYAEDVIRAVEREIRHIESMIRQEYPGAEYIELEPMSKLVDRFAIDDSVEEKLLMIEKETIQKFIRVVHQREKDKDPKLSNATSDKNSTRTESNDVR